MFRNSRRTLTVLVLGLLCLGLSGRSAQAQVFTPTQVQQMMRIRLMQANALNGIIQQLAASPTASVSNSPVQQTIALYQAGLAQVQYQINQLQLLSGALNQASAIYALIQNPQYQAALPNLQYALATVQAQISNLQSTVMFP